MVRRLSLSVRRSVACAWSSCDFIERNLACALVTSLLVEPFVDCSV